MEYFDLNLRPSELKHFSIQDAIAAIIENAITQYPNLAYWNQVIVKYNENENVLSISDNGNGINLKNFVQQLNNDGNLSTGIRKAIAYLLASNYQINFTSNFGTFTPVIRNKEGLSEIIPSIFIGYEPVQNKPSKWINIKSLIHPQSQNVHGTCVTISHLLPSTVKNTKYYFCFLQEWAKIMNTQAGKILIPIDNNQVNNFFLQGSNLTCLDEKGDYYHLHFLYSYDVNPAFFNQEIIEDSKLHAWTHNAYIISSILANLTIEDQAVIYPTLLKNQHSIEWSYYQVRKLVVQYFAKTNPNEYLIGVWESENEMLVEIAKQANKTIIWLHDNDEYYELINEGIQTVYDFGQAYLTNHFTSYVDREELSATKSKNWQAMQAFLTYFIKQNDVIAQSLKKHHQTNFNIKIVKNLPLGKGIYLVNSHFSIIDVQTLNDFATLAATVFNIIYAQIDDIKWEDYKVMWIHDLTDFVLEYNHQQTDK